MTDPYHCHLVVLAPLAVRHGSVLLIGVIVVREELVTWGLGRVAVEGGSPPDETGDDIQQSPFTRSLWRLIDS